MPSRSHRGASFTLTLVLALATVATPAHAGRFGCGKGRGKARCAAPGYRSTCAAQQVGYSACRGYSVTPAPAVVPPLPAPLPTPQVFPAPPIQATGKSLPDPGPTGTGSVGVQDHGFTAWLNAYRSTAGLAPVAYSPALCSIAAANNAAQNHLGMGHHVRGDRRQNAGMGPATAVWVMWTSSPSHNSALLDPTITEPGIHQSGQYWTFSAR